MAQKIRFAIVGDWQSDYKYAGNIETMLSYLLFGVLLAIVSHWFCEGFAKSNEN
jgi:hypothetical protein